MVVYTADYQPTNYHGKPNSINLAVPPEMGEMPVIVFLSPSWGLLSFWRDKAAKHKAGRLSDVDFRYAQNKYISELRNLLKTRQEQIQDWVESLQGDITLCSTEIVHRCAIGEYLRSLHGIYAGDNIPAPIQAPIEKQALNPTNLQPRQKILREFCRDGKSYWLTGWEIFDPEQCHSCTGKNGGFVPYVIEPKLGHAIVIGHGQEGRPIHVELNEIALLEHKPITYTFAEVFINGIKENLGTT